MAHPRDELRPELSRRAFLSVPATLAVAPIAIGQAGALPAYGAPAPPWYRRTLRWVQTNLNEDDPPRYDTGFWSSYWQRTRAQGLVVNAGGIVAFYPSRFDWHHRADRLGSRDLFGEIREAARQRGLVVLARMDSTRTYREVYDAHPDWFARDRAGQPFRSGRLYTVCVNGPWLTECIPAVLREIAERYRPDGFTDNSWSGLGQDRICYCPHCEQRFRDATGLALPASVDWAERTYREWIEWGYARRVEIWDAHDRVTRQSGGPDCAWIGMLQGDPSRMCAEFRHPSRLLSRTPLVMLDWQARRSSGESFHANAAAGKFVHGLLGWDRLVPESMPLYQGPQAPMFRHSAKPAAEFRMWAVSGIAAGIQPWFHHLGATQADTRQFEAAPPLARWHAENERALVDRQPLADVAVAWSERNIDFFGRGNSAVRVMQPYWGVVEALVESRIPWLPLHLDRLGERGPRFRVLVLPGIGAMSDAQCEAVRDFVRRGGGLVATGSTSACDEFGDPRPDFGLADVLGARRLPRSAGAGSYDGQKAIWDNPGEHTYLRFAASQGLPDLARAFGPTAMLPFGGHLEPVAAAPGSTVALSFVPPYPASPPEDVRPPASVDSPLPALLLRASEAGSRVAFLPADLDRCYARDRLPDHGRLLAELVRWAAATPMPVSVEGRGFVDVHLYSQPGRLVLHLVNLTNPAAWRAPATELFPIGPLQVRVRLVEGVQGTRVRCLVDQGLSPRPVVAGAETRFAIDRVLDHEVVTIE